jgi:hypothetical protein
MPVVLRHKGYRFFFYANEGAPREPIHVHVEKGGFEAKFWLLPDIAIAYNAGFNAKALREVTAIVVQYRIRIERAWNEFFGAS